MSLIMLKVALATVCLVASSHGLPEQDAGSETQVNGLLRLLSAAHQSPAFHSSIHSRGNFWSLSAQKANRKAASPYMFFEGLLPTTTTTTFPFYVPPENIVATAREFMPNLEEFFKGQTEWQASLWHGGNFDLRAQDEAEKELRYLRFDAPVVLFTYGLSPFSAEAIKILQSSNANAIGADRIKVVELGKEWFLLGKEGSALRWLFRRYYKQSSLPICFINGECVGGFATGGKENTGLVGLLERNELYEKLRQAGAFVVVR